MYVRTYLVVMHIREISLGVLPPSHYHHYHNCHKLPGREHKSHTASSRETAASYIQKRENLQSQSDDVRHIKAELYNNEVSVSENRTLVMALFCDRRAFGLCLRRLAGLVVTASASGAEDPGFESRLRRDCSGSSHTTDLKIGTPVVNLPGAWRYRVSTGTGWPGVSIL